RMVRLIADLSEDWRRLDDRIAIVSAEIEALVEEDGACQRLMTVPGIRPIISSAVVAAIGDGAGFKAATLAPGLVWGRDRSRREIARSWARSPSGVTSTCERCSCRLPRSSSPGDRARPGEVYGLGSSRHRSGSTATCWRSHWPTSWLVSPGPCSPAVENISR